MNKLRIIFFGTPEFAVAGLSNLFEKGYDIAAVVTAPDRPAGRGRQLNESAVKQFAAYNNLPILQPTNLKDENFLKEIKEYDANLFIVVAFRMMPEVLWKMPTHGTFNLHASLLPDYRGAAPINWAIINGEEKTGVTTFFIDEKIDTGSIILQKEQTITPDANAGQLHDQLMILGAELIEETVRLIKLGNVVRIPQSTLRGDKLKSAPKIFKEDCRIDWSQDGKSIYNKIRGLSPYPAAWSTLVHNPTGKELTFKIYAATLTEKEPENLYAILIKEDTIAINLKDACLNITQLQLQGKKRMSAAEFLRGFNLQDYHVV